jgi:excisionase family DNA binding protein
MKLSIKAAADSIGVSESLVYQWCQEQRLAHYRLGGDGRRGRIVIDSTALDEFLNDCKVGPHPLLKARSTPRKRHTS